MKRIFFNACTVAVMAVAVIACGRTGQSVSWDQAVMPVSQFAQPVDEIEVSYPVAMGGEAAEAINGRIQKELGVLLGYPEDDVAAAVDALLSERNKDTIGETIPYAMLINGEVLTIGRVASVRLSAYQYTGGAHGMSTVTSLNFDLCTGAELQLSDLFTDTVKLAQVNRAVFAALQGEGRLDSLPLFVEVEKLPLPAGGVGIDSTGLYIHYNPYEIMPYAYGPTDYEVPFAEIEVLLNKKVFRF